MRDVNRLPEIYEIILKEHKNFPDLRCWQLMLDFLGWHLNKYKNDGFYIEDTEFISRFKIFIEEMKGKN